MRTFLQNLLIVFALALCALISFQWVRETDLRKQLQTLTDKVHDRDQNLLQMQASIRQDESEIQRLDGINKQLSQTLKSNDVQIATLAKDLEKTTKEAEHYQQQSAAYKEAIETANANVKTANERIQTQNQEIQKIASERNDLAKKFNTLAEEHNDLVTKWNKQQEELARQATNKPSK